MHQTSYISTSSQSEFDAMWALYSYARLVLVTTILTTIVACNIVAEDDSNLHMDVKIVAVESLSLPSIPRLRT